MISRRAVAGVIAAGVLSDVLQRAAVRRWARRPDAGTRAAAPPPDRQTPVVTSDGARLRVVEWYGRGGAPVLLVHGITATLEDWLPLLPILLEAGHRVVAVDLRGHGGSTLGSQRVSTERLADDLADVLGACDLSSAVLAGHSLGGYAALALATHHRGVVEQRVARIVVIGSTSTMRNARELATLAGISSPLTKAVQSRPRQGAVLMRLQAFGKNPSLSDIEDLRARWSRCPLSTRLAYATGLAGQSVTGALGSVSVPVTVVWGSRDRVAPARRSRLIRSRVPAGELVTLDGAGHVAIVEQPRQVAALFTREVTALPPVAT